MPRRNASRGHAVVLRVLPCTLLILVAGHQLFLVYTAQLSPWLGGGFGMFSTIDDGVNRYLRVYLLEPEGKRAVEIPRAFDAHSERVRVLPSARAMRRFAVALAPFYTAPGRCFAALRVEVWRTDYAADKMRPGDRLIGAMEWPANHECP